MTLIKIGKIVNTHGIKGELRLLSKFPYKDKVFINNMNITPYEKGNIFNKDPLRPKKLLLHQSEINKLAGQIAQKGYTIVPLQVYLSKGRVKMEIGLGRGKKLYDKRDSIAKKDQKREAEKEFKVRNLY